MSTLTLKEASAKLVGHLSRLTSEELFALKHEAACGLLTRLTKGGTTGAGACRHWSHKAKRPRRSRSSNCADVRGNLVVLWACR